MNDQENQYYRACSQVRIRRLSGQQIEYYEDLSALHFKALTLAADYLNDAFYIRSGGEK